MEYECMTPQELALWEQGAAEVLRSYPDAAKKPCFDCPMWFRLAEYQAGRCRLPKPVRHDDPEKMRSYKREWMRKARLRRLQGAQS